MHSPDLMQVASNVDGSYNCFYGIHSGTNNTSGHHNTFFGYSTGITFDDGHDNTFVGGGAAPIADGANTVYNSFFGSQVALNFTTGERNTFMGYLADIPFGGPTNLICATAIGSNSTVRASYKMILGSDSVNVGIGLSDDNVSNGPTNKLEINTGPSYNPITSGTGTSGLRFRQLNAHCSPESNPGTGVLSVTNDGDVIYVPAFGHVCGTSPSNALTADHEVPLGGHTFYFSGTTACSDNVGIGMACTGINPMSKFHVVQSAACVSHGFGFSNAGEFTNRAGSSLARAVLGTVSNAATVMQGIYGFIPIAGTAATTSFAIYGDLGITPCVSPPCAPSGDFAGYFNGDVLSTTGNFLVSDASLKENIDDLTDPMIVINQLHPKSYTFNQQANQSMILPVGTHFGLLAQDVYDVLPQLTKDCLHPARYDSLGNETYAAINYKAINYTELIPFLIAGMKEQQQRIEELEELVNSPQQLHQNPNGDDTGNSIDVVLASKSIVLNQNVPNPFKEETTIEYFIPDDAQQVKIIFTDNKGSILKEVEIIEKGKGQLNVYAADLSSGIYTYTIVADGITIDSKQMVKTK